MKQQLSSRGFSLVELLIVVAILAILTSLAVPSYQRYVHRAQAAELVLKMDRLRGALAELEATTGKRIGSDLRVFSQGDQLQWCEAVPRSRTDCVAGSTQPLGGIGQAELASSAHGVRLAVNASSGLPGSTPGTFFVLSIPRQGDLRSRQVALAFTDLMKPHATLVMAGSTATTLRFQLGTGAGR